MFNGKTAGFLFAGILAISGCATMDSSAPARYSGGVMVDPAGMTLYTFDKDPAGGGKSVCNGGCAKNWPPLTAASGESAGGGFGIIMRDDGSRQWAYEGKPLYRWIKDKKPGDRTGDGFRSVWHVVHREASSGGMRSGY
jgi:predicted lipoprotein with Yx(FWY)xxD motif